MLVVADEAGGKKGSWGDLVLMCHNAGCGPPPSAKKSPLNDAAPSQLPNLALRNCWFCPGFNTETWPALVRKSQILAVPSSDAEANSPVVLH